MVNRCKNIEGSIGLFDVFIAIYLFVAMSGSTNDLYLYITIILYFILVVVLLCKTGFVLNLSDRRLLSVCVFLLFITVFGYPVGGTLYTAKKVGAALIEFSPILIYCYYKKQNNKKSIRFISLVSLLIVVFYMLSAYSAYTNLSVNARRIADHSVDYGELSIGGGYNLAYASALLGVFILDSLSHRKTITIKQKVLLIGVAVLATLVVYETLSTVTLLAYAVGLIVTLFIPPVEKNSQGKYQLWKPILIVFVTILISLVSMRFIGENLIKIGTSNSTILGTRIRSLGEMLGGIGGDYSSGRLSIPVKSFQTFLQNPLIGICYHHGNGFYKPTLFGAGNHCEWIDALCNYGIIGGIPFLAIYWASVKEIYKTGGRKIGLGLAVTVVIMGIFNPFRCIQSNTILLLVIPLMQLMFNYEESLGIIEKCKTI